MHAPKPDLRNPKSIPMENITDIFVHYITTNPSLDIAESEFKRALIDDPELRADYRQWCRDNGSSEKNGFADYCEEYMTEQDNVWNSLTDYDNME